MLARRGRKRRAVKRHPCGKVLQGDRQSQEDIQGVVKSYRLKLVAGTDVMDQRSENPLGRYCMAGQLDPDEHKPGRPTERAKAMVEAGKQYASLTAAVKRDLDSPAEDAVNRGYANLLPSAPGSLRTPETEEEAIRGRNSRKRRHGAAVAILRARGLWVVDAVNTVALRERSVGADRFDYLRNGLGALAVHFGLTK